MKKMVKSEYPSSAIFALTDWIRPDQSRFRCEPKNRSFHPAGTAAEIASGEILTIATTATATEETVRTVNWRSSVTTTLYIPPATT